MAAEKPLLIKVKTGEMEDKSEKNGMLLENHTKKMPESHSLVD